MMAASTRHIGTLTDWLRPVGRAGSVNQSAIQILYVQGFQYEQEMTRYMAGVTVITRRLFCILIYFFNSLRLIRHFD